METTPDQMERGCRRAEYTSAVSTRLLGGRPLDLQLSKHDFTIVLLRSLGPANVSSAVVNDIFEQIDKDKNGFINAAELSSFLQAEKHGRFSNFMIKRLVHVPNVGSSMFVCGSSLSILNNVWKRSQELEGVMVFVSYIIMWLFLIGSSLFALDFARTTIKSLRDEGVESLAMQLLQKNLSSIEQITNLMWLFGSLAYVLASLSKHLTLSSAATSGLWMIGGIIYFFGGLLALPSIYRSTSAKINQQEEMLQKIRGIIESKCGVSEVSIDTQKIISPEETIVLRSISAARRRSLSESSMQPMHPEPSHQRQNTCPVMIDIVLDADTFPQEKIPKRCSAESLKTLDTESLTRSEDDSYSRRRSDCSFEDSTDSNISCDDVYSSLSSSDAPIDVDVFVQALQGMYAKGQIDKSLHEQFANKVDNLKLCQEIAMSSSFYIAILYTVAGALFTIGAIDIGLTNGAVQNIFLTGSCIYFCGGSFGLFKQWKAARSSWDTLQSVVSALQQYTLQETTTRDVSLGNWN